MNAPLRKDANEPAGSPAAASSSSVPSGEILPPVPGAEPPIETEGTRLGKSSQAAAGVKAMINTFTYAWGQMGLARGTSSLLKVNQVNGFDCQSCAWPDARPSPRHVFGVLRERGEGRRRRGHARPRGAPRPTCSASIRSVAELSALSDHWR